MPAKSIEITHKENYEFDVDFWRGFHFEVSGKKVALAKIFLDHEGSEKRLSFAKYLSAKRTSLPRAIPILIGELPKMEFPASRISAIAYGLSILSENETQELQKRLSEIKSDLRGMGDGSIIVCGNGNSFLKASHCVGAVPSVESQRVEYPDATYRDRDTDTVMVYSGQPQIVSVWSKEELPYPTKFRFIKKAQKRDYTNLWFAFKYKTKALKCCQPTVAESFLHFGAF